MSEFNMYDTWSEGKHNNKNSRTVTDTDNYSVRSRSEQRQNHAANVKITTLYIAANDDLNVKLRLERQAFTLNCVQSRLER